MMSVALNHLKRKDLLLKRAAVSRTLYYHRRW